MIRLPQIQIQTQHKEMFQLITVRTDPHQEETLHMIELIKHVAIYLHSQLITVVFHHPQEEMMHHSVKE